MELVGKMKLFGNAEENFISKFSDFILLWSKEVLVTLCFTVLSFISTCYTSTGWLITANLLNDRQGIIQIPPFKATRFIVSSTMF